MNEQSSKSGLFHKQRGEFLVALAWLVVCALAGASCTQRPSLEGPVAADSVVLPTVYASDTPRPSPTATPTVTITPTPGPSATASATPTITLTPTTGAGSARVNSRDGAVLIYIPAGDFLMGSDRRTDPYFYGAEGPSHSVYLETYWIYQTEVTNAMYQACAAEQACPRPARSSSNTRLEYYGVPAYDNFPVVYVSWVHAVSYCRWAGGRLPTEAEWEKAGRGADGRLFPWGDSPPRPDQANFGVKDTVAVGSYPAGASPYGVLDMSGNVIEWAFDYFQSTYYQASPYENPRGPSSGRTRAYRGGSYHNLDAALRVVMRGSRAESHADVDIGFRCVVDDS